MLILPELNTVSGISVKRIFLFLCGVVFITSYAPLAYADEAKGSSESAANLPSTATVKPKTSAKVKQLINTLGLKDQTDQSFVQIEAAIKMSATNIAKSLPSSKELDSIISGYQQKVVEEYRKMFSWEAQSAIYQNTYTSRMTEAELDSVIKFLSTPAGVKMLAAQTETSELYSARAEQQKQLSAPKLQALKKGFIAELTVYAEKQK